MSLLLFPDLQPSDRTSLITVTILREKAYMLFVAKSRDGLPGFSPTSVRTSRSRSAHVYTGYGLYVSHAHVRKAAGEKLVDGQ